MLALSPPVPATALALVLLSTVSAAGLALGNLKLRGIGLGSAGVLFVGLAAGGLGFGIDHEVLDFVRELGLMLFVFMMGLQLGPGFFASLRKAGVKLNALALAIVFLGFGASMVTGQTLVVDGGLTL